MQETSPMSGGPEAREREISIPEALPYTDNRHSLPRMLQPGTNAQ